MNGKETHGIGIIRARRIYGGSQARVDDCLSFVARHNRARTVYAYTSRFMHNYASVIVGTRIEKMQLDSEINILGIVNTKSAEMGIKMK